MEKLLMITFIGYMTNLIGFLGGTSFSVVTNKFDSKFHGTLMGFTGGLLIAFICFEMLPPAFENHGIGLVIIGIISGVACSIILENKFEKKSSLLSKNQQNRYLKTGMLLVVGIVIHKIPEGMAVGSLLNYNLAAGLSMSIIICMHCFPEGIAVALSLKNGGIKYKEIFIGCFLISIPMALGSFVGAILSDISSIFIAICLSFASGIMIYITCGGIIPESKQILKGNLSTIGAVIGFALGVLIIYSV